VSPVRYELGFYIPEDDILHSHRHEILRSYIVLWVSCGGVRQRTLTSVSSWPIAPVPAGREAYSP
jgi:hypothetical protein